MSLSPKVKEQLDELVKIPTITVTRDNIPYECKEDGSSKRFRCRRYIYDSDQLDYELYKFIIDNNIPLVKVLEFSSGTFLNFADNRSIYS